MGRLSLTGDVAPLVAGSQRDPVRCPDGVHREQPEGEGRGPLDDAIQLWTARSRSPSRTMTSAKLTSQSGPREPSRSIGMSSTARSAEFTASAARVMSRPRPAAPGMEGVAPNVVSHYNDRRHEPPAWLRHRIAVF